MTANLKTYLSGAVPALVVFIVLGGFRCVNAQPAAPAPPARVYVSAQKGADTNNCTLAAPCRTIARALTMVAAGGEVILLDTGDYDPVVVTMSVTIAASPGVTATIRVTSTIPNGVKVAAPADAVVVLRGLTIQGASGIEADSAGILFSSGARLYIENCIINGFQSRSGFAYAIKIFTSGPSRTFISNTTVRETSGSGIRVESVGQMNPRTTIVSIDGSRVEGSSGPGIFATGAGVSLTIRNTVVAGNGVSNDFGGGGIAATSNATVTVDSSQVTGDAKTGITAQGNSVIRVSNTTISGNQTGLSAGDGGQILSRGNNTVEDNGMNGDFTGTYGAK
jgi:hypothetical protein